MPYSYFYIDWYYLVLVVPAMIIAVIAQIHVKSTFGRYSREYSRKGLTGAQVAEMILRKNGVMDVSVQQVQGNLTDHYDPRAKAVRLSDSVYGSTSIAAIGVAAHETGHAIQHANGYFPIKIREAVIPAAKFGSTFGILIAVVGYFMASDILINLGLILFSLVTVFQFITLPVEFNASRRALGILKDEMVLDDGELGGAKKVLTAAAMTYVAAFLTSLASLLRLILIMGNRRDRN